MSKYCEGFKGWIKLSAIIEGELRDVVIPADDCMSCARIDQCKALVRATATREMVESFLKNSTKAI